ncbi:MAG TPA: RecQ family ATP-dependent DNA helicase, partial [Nevskiaceae bacterium]|nr:RecQ family ATP-dependent DNA helicase [Nevskiaceae bacterium]
VSQWGHDFRPEYRQLDVLPERFPGVPRVALTATADVRTRREIVDCLRLQAARAFVSSFDRPNIRYRVEAKRNGRAQLLDFLAGHRGESGIVYCLSRRKVEAVAEFLIGKGFDALPYHAGFDAETRARHQRRFVHGDGVIVVATVAFGMGIDKPDVRFVAHMDVPRSIEGYYQETGRAGRDGLPAEAWMAYGLADVVGLRQLIDRSPADDVRKHVERSKLEALLAYAETTRCRRELLLGAFDEAFSGPCGNCDNCLSSPATWDATVAAQKALSAVYRSGQRFGAGYVIDILRGMDGPRVRELGHDHLSTFGIGRELDGSRWQAVFRQLLAGGFLAVNEHGALRLTPESRPLLRGEQPLRLRQALRPARSGTQRKRTVASPASEMVEAAERALWERLRAVRKRLASEHGVPPYVIFHDATLLELLRARPTTAEQFGKIGGVGQAKRQRYAAAFIEVFRESAAADRET